jgi:hypothetical protein
MKNLKREYLQEYSAMPIQQTAQLFQEQDLAVRLQQADQRRASDRSLRQTPAACAYIADDTPALLKTILNEPDEGRGLDNDRLSLNLGGFQLYRDDQ